MRILLNMHPRFPVPLLSVFLMIGSAAAQTGIAIPSMSNCDAQLQGLLNTYDIPGAQFAISRQGKLVYDRAFGHADLLGQEPLRPDHLFRIASVSKPITAVAIFTLIESGELALTDRVFGAGGLLDAHPVLGQVSYTDQRLEDITVQHLLHHTAGWDRSINCFPSPTTPYTWTMPGCDPISAPLHITSLYGESGPVSRESLIRFVMERGLDHAPGSTYAYSNMGYLVLGFIIEQVTGQSYGAYVQNAVFDPLGICDAHLGRNLRAEKLEREVEYTGEGYQAPSCYGTGGSVPWEYGGWNLEAMDAHGGWVLSARELVKLLVAVDGFSTKPDLLGTASIAAMTAASAQNANYASGWQVNSANNWWHTGSLDGTASMVVRSANGYTWALLLNKRLTNAQANAFWGAVDGLGWNCISGATSWPTHDLMAMPMVSTSDVQADVVGPGTVQLTFTPGDGTGRLVVMSASGAPAAFPVDGVDHAASSTFGAGADLGNGNYVVYAGAGSTVDVSGLSNTTYVVRVFEYTKNSATGQHALYKRCGRSDVETAVNVSVEELHEHAVLEVRHTSVRVDDGVTGPVRIDIMDSAGRTVRTRTMTGGAQEELGDLSPGVYNVQVTTTVGVQRSVRVAVAGDR